MSLMLDKTLRKRVEDMLGARIEETKTPPQGGTSEVIFATTSTKREVVIKIHQSAKNGELTALKLLRENRINVPFPKIFHAFCWQGREVLLMEKVPYPLLEGCAKAEKEKYLTSMVRSLQKIHQVRSEYAGYVKKLNSQESWRDFLLARFDGRDESFNWEQIAARKSLDGALVRRAVMTLREKIKKDALMNAPYVLLHTDFNQRNLFVDPASDQITAIIDWGEATFGDPLYDFARLKLLMWHFDFSSVAVRAYEKLTNFSSEEKVREEIYFLSLMIEYLAYYSEQLCDFNLKRIAKHQVFLKSIFND